MESPDPSIFDIVRMGRIASVDAATATCTVQLGDMTTPPLPWYAGRAGKTRRWSAPSVGEQCLLICPEGDTAAGIVFAGIYANAFSAPASDPETDQITFADGAVLSYDAKGHALVANLPAGATASIRADGGIAFTGDVTITGALKVSKDVAASGDVTASGISLQSHTHGGVKAGSDDTGAPQCVA